jgi:hypothetical protein
VTTRLVLVAIRIDDTQGSPTAGPFTTTDADLVAAVRARLDEVYPTDDGYPFVPTSVSATAVDLRVARHMLSAVAVGTDGSPLPELDETTLAAAARVLA